MSLSQCLVILRDNKEASAVLDELGVDFAEDLELLEKLGVARCLKTLKPIHKRRQGRPRCARRNAGGYLAPRGDPTRDGFLVFEPDLLEAVFF